MHRLIAGMLTVSLVLVACGDSTGPQGRAHEDLQIVHQDVAAPPLVATEVSFWAKAGEGREVRLQYQGATPADTAEEFLRFRVPGNALLRRPDGMLFQEGDSILITITVVDPAQFHFRFEPSGLQFDPDHPARLKVRYYSCDFDFDGDGDIDEDDAAIEERLDVWQRTGLGALWFRVGAVNFDDLDELDANIRSFSEYAVAW